MYSFFYFHFPSLEIFQSKYKYMGLSSQTHLPSPDEFSAEEYRFLAMEAIQKKRLNNKLNEQRSMCKLRTEFPPLYPFSRDPFSVPMHSRDTTMPNTPRTSPTKRTTAAIEVKDMEPEGLPFIVCVTTTTSSDQPEAPIIRAQSPLPPRTVLPAIQCRCRVANDKHLKAVVMCGIGYRWGKRYRWGRGFRRGRFRHFCSSKLRGSNSLLKTWAVTVF